jgi:hypothetical protein
MLAALVAAAVSFMIVFLGLRLTEFVYHRLRHTPDGSPHWGSWVFGVLAGLYVFGNYLGR